MKEDSELLRRFADDEDESAFRELVERHLGLVYSSALRQLNGDAHLASDVAQLVFTDLARKARSLANHRVLTGWLFTSTRFAVSKLVRTEQRRRVRELEALHMEDLATDPAASLDWSRVRPVLDEVLSDLSAADREAILLRYFERLEYQQIGARLNLTDNTARMRVQRALDVLRAGLARRGVTSSSAALATVLASEAVAAAPAGLASSVAGAALAGGGAASVWVTLMSMTKLQVGITGALAVAGATGLAVQANTNASLREEIAELHRQTAEVSTLQAQNLQLARTAAEADALRKQGPDFTRLAAEAAELKIRVNAVAQRRAAAAQRADKVFDVAALDQLPKPRVRVPPRYPVELRRAGVSGEVTVDFVVDQNGAVKNARAVKASSPEFESAAVEAVSQWEFDAGMKGGRVVNTHLQVPIVFSLSADEVRSGEPVPVPFSPAAPKG